MSKFITNSSNFSESHYLKSKLLKPILESYNKLLLEETSTFVDKMEPKRFIPNNGRKYYLFVTNKSNIQNTKSNYKILYFFTENNNQDDFFIETEYTSIGSSLPDVLFEGYIYNKEIKPDYLVTDLLYYGTRPQNCDYTLRLKLIEEIVHAGINDINCFMDIHIHPTFKCNDAEAAEADMEDTPLLAIFKSNFVYAKELTNVEFVKERCIGYKKIKTSNMSFQPCEKHIQKTNYSDTYKVFDIETGNAEGILYVKTIDISKRLRELTRDTNNLIKIKCEYNTSFCKWAPSLTN
jgi:hypothetical protein